MSRNDHLRSHFTVHPGDDGAVIPEFALMLPFLALVFLGIFEFGMAWRQHEDIDGATRGAARTASNRGENRDADFSALTTLVASLSNLQNTTVDKVVIYKTTNVNGNPVNASCLTNSPSASGTGISGACNIYGAAQLATLTNGTFDGSSCGSDDWDRWWCPVNRESSQGAGSGPDFLGIQVTLTYDSFTGLIPDVVTFTDRAVYRLEPSID